MPQETEAHVRVSPTEIVTIKGTTEAVMKHVRFIEAHRDEWLPCCASLAGTTEESRWYRRGFHAGSEAGLKVANEAMKLLPPAPIVISKCTECGKSPNEMLGRMGI
jgi:hypothetical protein